MRRFSCVLLLFPLLAACNSSPAAPTDAGLGGDGSAGDAGAPDSGDPGTDTDGDGLTDFEEARWGTNPAATDTDGDGYSDFTEVVTNAFNPDVNVRQFNPRIADVPEIRIELASAPTIGMSFTESTGTSTTLGTERTASTTSANTHSWGGSSSLAIEESHTVGVSVGASTDFSGVMVEASVSYEETFGTTNETTSEWSDAQSRENSTAYTAIDERSRQMGVTTTGGYFEVALRISNPGYIAYRLNNLTLTAYTSDRANPLRVSPIGTLVPGDPTAPMTFPETVLTPGEVMPAAAFSTTLGIETTRQLLLSPGGLVVAPLTYTLMGQGDINFELAATTIGARTATVLIDYGVGTRQEEYRVATVLDQAHPGVSLPTVLDDILRVPFTVGTAPFDLGPTRTPGMTFNGITSVRTTNTDRASTSYWILAHTHTVDAGARTVTDYYNPLLAAYDPASITLQKGETLHLVYVEDPDRDSLGTRAELLHGTDPNDADTDDDGLTDAFELAGWDITVGGMTVHVVTDPLVADTDSDLASDGDEYAAGTDPAAFVPNVLPVIDSCVVTPAGFDASLALAVSDADGVVNRVRIDWGDGSPVDDLTAGPYTMLTVPHTFPRIATFTVTVQAFDNRLGASTAVTRMVTPAAPTDSLALYTRFDRSLTSATGPAFTAADPLQVYVTDRLGFGERAFDVYNMGAADSEQVLSTGSSLSLAGGSFSMSAWVKLEPTPGGGFPIRIFGQGDSFGLYMTSTTDMSFGRTTGTAPAAGSAAETASFSGMIDNMWHLWTGVVENLGGGMSAVRLYRDGSLVQERMVATTFTTASTCRFYAGNFAASDTCMGQTAQSGRRSYGMFDDLRVYRRALRAGEVSILAAATP